MLVAFRKLTEKNILRYCLDDAIKFICLSVDIYSDDENNEYTLRESR